MAGVLAFFYPTMGTLNLPGSRIARGPTSAGGIKSFQTNEPAGLPLVLANVEPPA